MGDNPNNVDLAIVGPGITIMAHQVDEYIEKDMYLKYIDIYKDVAVKYLAEKVIFEYKTRRSTDIHTLVGYRCLMLRLFS